MINTYNMDCMGFMRDVADVEYDLAVVDPPYGGGQRVNFRWNDDPNKKVYDNLRPDKIYFDELFRISKNQIIWGGNYFTDYLYISRGWICWDKNQSLDDFSDFELAWSSFNRPTKLFRLPSFGFNHADKRHTGQSTIHPTQKPVKLYEWLLMNYAKPGYKIIDTHGGSGSILIAAHNLGVDLDWMEIDKEYYDAALKRFKNHKAQLTLFKLNEL